MFLLHLVQQGKCKVDSDTLELYKFKVFQVNTHGHLRCHIANNKKEYLHRLVMNPPAGYVVDHIDGDPSNNLRSNLRVVSQSENLFNTGNWSHNTSGVKGVSLNKRTGKYVAYIKIGGKNIHLGYYNSIESAARARELAERLR